MFDAEVGPMSEEDEKLEKEYNEKNELFKESLREMRECVGMMNEDPKTDEGYKVLRAFGVKRQWIDDVYDYSSNDTNNYKSRPIIYKYSKRVGDWIWIHDEREERERYEAYDWAKERESIDEATDKIMRTKYRFEPIEEEEDLNLNDMFNEPSEFTGEETRDFIGLNNRIASWTDGRSRHRWNLERCLGRIQNGEINYSSAYNYAGYALNVDSDSDTDSSMPELEEVEHVEPEHAIAMSRGSFSGVPRVLIREGERGWVERLYYEFYESRVV